MCLHDIIIWIIHSWCGGPSFCSIFSTTFFLWLIFLNKVICSYKEDMIKRHKMVLSLHNKTCRYVCLSISNRASKTYMNTWFTCFEVWDVIFVCTFSASRLTSMAAWILFMSAVLFAQSRENKSNKELCDVCEWFLMQVWFFFPHFSVYNNIDRNIWTWYIWFWSWNDDSINWSGGQ